MSAAGELARAFSGRLRGAFRDDPVARHLYSTDASPYRIEPAGVLVAGSTDDLHAAVEVSGELGVSITPRGAGTSLSGQCVGPGLALDCAGLDGVQWIDPDRRLARVAPGATWWALNEAARHHGLEFGPDPATKRQCTLGGMVGTNAGGTHSVVYGAAVDHVHAVEGLLPDGRAARFEGSGDGSLSSAGAPEDVADALQAVRDVAGPMLGPRYTDLARRGSGYQLEHLCAERPHLGKLLAGSEGTLALTTALEVTLDPRPRARVLALVGFEDLHAAIANVPGLVVTGPCAVELLSKSMVDIARSDPLHAGAVAGVDPDAGAFLFVEYQGDSIAEAASGFERMDGVLEGARFVDRLTDPAACARRWAIREAGVGSMTAVASGPRMPSPFVEDTVVAVEKLPPYIAEFAKIFEAHGLDPVWYGHASTGLIHVRPFIDMTSADELRTLASLSEAVVDLVRDWEADLSGEHGDGLVRTHWNERLLGAELYAQLKGVKAAFDPENRFNPGKVVDGPEPLTNLRYGAGYRRREVPTRLGFADQGGFAQAAERCFGAGVCRKRGMGTMCPPAAASGLEEHSTRARANLLRGVASGALDPRELSGDAAREVMETCVACKACKTECPARVDMARLKAEWMDKVRSEEGASPVQRTIGNFRRLARLGSLAAPIANAVQGSALAKRALGIAPGRSLPPFASKPLTKRLPSVEELPGEVLLYPDCFTTYQEPEVGEAAAALIGAAGRNPALAPAGCCGRVMLSEGYVERARAAARRAAAALRRTRGAILFCEPSCLSAVTDDWPHLIGDVDDIASRCRLAEDWVADHGGALRFAGGGRAIFHGHCHQKALWGTGGTERALGMVPDLEVDVLDAGCCGMAGAFGYLEERYDLSVAMAERVLLPAVREAPDGSVIAPGTSCRHQVGDLAGREALHPVSFLAERLIP